MRHPFTLSEGNFGGRDLDCAVDLNGIAVDYFTIKSQCDFNAQGTLAGRSWTNNCNDRVSYWRGTHARENSTRKRITSQMRLSNNSPPISWLRVKRIVRKTGGDCLVHFSHFNSRIERFQNLIVS
jgi:hypothetical protein